MGFWDKLLSNEVLISAVVGWTVAQVLKTLIDFGLNKSFTPERLVGSGGMPSSHSCYGFADLPWHGTLLRGRFVSVCHQLYTGSCSHV